METITFELPDESQQVINELAGHTLPNSDVVSNWALEKERKYFFDVDVGFEILAFMRLVLRWNMEDKDIPVEQRKPIWLYVMSYGGDIDYMWAALEIIGTAVTPIYTVNMGVAASAASLIFIAGHKRFMMPTARLIIHEGSAQLAGDAVKVMDQSESYKKQLKQMKTFILEHTEIPRSQLMKKRNNDWELDAAYCLEHKATDFIINTINDVI